MSDPITQESNTGVTDETIGDGLCAGVAVVIAQTGKYAIACA
jgi:hypothetical protein